jgi:hypothetical protein
MDFLEDLKKRQIITIILLIFFIGMDAYIIYVASQYYPYEQYWMGECAKRVDIVDSWCRIHAWDIDPSLNHTWKDRLREWMNTDTANLSNSSWVMG